jgi:hypothetical protein
MDKCPGLIGGLNDPSTSCNIPNPVNEVISGTMSALPGNNPVGTWGGGQKPAPPSSATTTSTAVAKTSTKPSAPSGTAVVAPGWKYYGCYTDTNARVLTGVLFANIGQNAATNTLCVA